MTPESESCSYQVLESHTGAGGSSALKLEQEAKREEYGSEAAVSAYEVDPSADHQGDKTTFSNSLAGSEPLSEAKHNNDRPMDSPVSSLSYPGSVKKPNSGENGPLDDSFSKLKCSGSPEILEQSEQWSMVSVSPCSGDGKFSTEFLPQNAGNMFESSPMKPPSVQSMTSPSGYDPDRIPSSIFSSGPTSPAEWSVASNESLFSIQMGNNSFSRDYAYLFGETKPEDWCNSPLHVTNVSEPKSNEDSNIASNLPPVSETASENDKKSVDITDDSLADKDFPLPRTENLPEISVERDKEKVAAGGRMGRLSVTASNLSEGRRLSSVEGGHSMNAPRGSNGSADSCGSFAFPLLVENGRSGRSCSQRTMSGTQANKEKEEEPPLPETQNQEPEPAAKCTWFSCRMCWPGCCPKLCL